MALIIATGSNLGDSLQLLKQAELELTKIFELVAASRVYRSNPVDYLDQPPFFNQVLQFILPNLKPEEVLAHIQKIEAQLGPAKTIPKGPRHIDLDLIFFGETQLKTAELEVPHPSWTKRGFVYLPLLELPAAKTLSWLKNFRPATDPSQSVPL